MGHIPRPGVATVDAREGGSSAGSGFALHIDDHRIRSNGNFNAADRPSTLVVGDSFAFGDQVGDDQSWPAHLERLLGSRVLNAGVPGFGLDQAVLWAERLSEDVKPDRIIVGFIPHDVVRCEISSWPVGAKPYFDIDTDGALRFHPLQSAGGERRQAQTQMRPMTSTAGRCVRRKTRARPCAM